MPSFMSFFFTTLFTLAVITPAALAAGAFKVGGDERWRQPSANETEKYSQWASKQRFHIGDSLRPVNFVSGDPDHCKNGQRLMVEVITPHRSLLQPYMDASPAAAPFSSAGSFSIVPELVFLYVFVAVSINI
ncbi:hypothetical protein CDL12_03084 [Handroanthus impetiginosus]|uniref:Phytocyanin domain-containing protein n=1 Tax=Handroanthus impetiginosus TaxID=429701 RepID=A0A2G9I3J5_9LAMI|nr:hypothetical protein CDL12_03084 [Handroanthus impetiginosus]